MQHISVTELDQLLKSDNGNSSAPVLIDVREQWEFTLCHISGSQLIPMRQIPDNIDELDPDQDVVVICHTGVRSQHVCMFLEQNGFSRVSNLTGGVHAWANEVDSSMATY